MRKLLLCLLGLCLVGLAACSRSEPEKNEIVVAAGGLPKEVQLWKALLADYQKKHPGLTVTLRTLPANSDLTLQALSTALGSGAAPYDLVRLDLVWLSAFASKGWLAPLDDLLPEDADKPFGTLLERVDRIGGKLYALPWNVDMGLLYARTDLLAKHGFNRQPRTWDELMQMAEAVVKGEAETGNDLVGFVWQGKAYEGLTCNFVEYYASAGGSMAEVEKNKAWQRKPAERALSTMRQLMDRKLSPANTPTEMIEEPSRLLFQSGKAVFMRNWPYAQALLAAADSKVKGKFSVMPLPGFDGRQGAATVGGWHLGVCATSKKRKQAAELAAYLTSAPVQLRMATEAGWNPSRDDVYDLLRKEGGAAGFEPVRQSLSGAVARPRLPDYPEFSERTYQVVNKVLLGTLKPDEAAAALARR